MRVRPQRRRRILDTASRCARCRAASGAHYGFLAPEGKGYFLQFLFLFSAGGGASGAFTLLIGSGECATFLPLWSSRSAKASFYDQESDLALRGGVATRLCEVVVRRDIDGGARGWCGWRAERRSGQRREAVERRPRRPLAEATSRTDQQRAAGRG